MNIYIVRNDSYATHTIKIISDRFPAAIVYLGFQFPTDSCRYSMRKPDVAEEFVVSFLVENELAIATQTRVNFAVFVKVRRIMP